MASGLSLQSPPHRTVLTFRSIFPFFVQKYSVSIYPHPPSKPFHLHCEKSIVAAILMAANELPHHPHWEHGVGLAGSLKSQHHTVTGTLFFHLQLPNVFPLIVTVITEAKWFHLLTLAALYASNFTCKCLTFSPFHIATSLFSFL